MAVLETISLRLKAGASADAFTLANAKVEHEYLPQQPGFNIGSRVTTLDDFDGLPVPSPDGKKLVWTSSRHSEKGAQLYLANWNHETAMQALAVAPLRKGTN